MQKRGFPLALLLLLALSALLAEGFAANPGGDEVQVTGITITMVDTATGQSYTTSGQGFTTTTGSQKNMGIGIAGASISSVQYNTAGFAAAATNGAGGSSVTSYFSDPTTAYSGPLSVTVYYASSTQISGSQQASLIAPTMCGILGTTRSVMELLTLVLMLIAAALVILSSVMPGTSRESLRRYAIDMAMGGVGGLIIVVVVPFMLGIFIFPAAPYALPC